MGLNIWKLLTLIVFIVGILSVIVSAVFLLITPFDYKCGFGICRGASEKYIVGIGIGITIDLFSGMFLYLYHEPMKNEKKEQQLKESLAFSEFGEKREIRVDYRVKRNLIMSIGLGGIMLGIQAAMILGISQLGIDPVEIFGYTSFFTVFAGVFFWIGFASNHVRTMVFDNTLAVLEIQDKYPLGITKSWEFSRDNIEGFETGSAYRYRFNLDLILRDSRRFVLYVDYDEENIMKVKRCLQPLIMASKQGRILSIGKWTRIHTLDTNTLGFRSVSRDPSEARINTILYGVTLVMVVSIIAIVILLNYSNLIITWICLLLIILMGVPFGILFFYYYYHYAKRDSFFVDVLFDRQEGTVRIRRKMKQDILNFEAGLNIHVVNPVRRILTFGSIPIFISAEVAQVTKMEHLITSFIKGKPLRLETVDLDTLGEI